MPGNAPPSSDEAQQLLAFLTQQRDGLLNAAYGLTEEQLRATPTVSTLSIGGLLKHAASVERGWADTIAGRPGPGEVEDYLADFTMTDAESLASLRAGIAEAAAATVAAVAVSAGVTAEVTLPEAPWMPTEGGHTVRWVLLHLLEELARHAGHADLLREHVDGATMYTLMAAAEGWPETPWLKPWRPPVG